ncbi:uncharacterized protein LOC113305867 [Papaver somniferum]|uniref:uncharacterized protein LOC113305867 n=1 Tax=Papaver somniferum TaxID=3469 RepID=UPI000E6FC421|nr:uncharacterized protein LOC113305867 [Papaver somniferum]
MERRIKILFDKVISPLQSAYVPGRLISDNISLTHEIIHTLKRKKKGDNYLALKLDMSKAFDRLEWSFITEVMKRMGFSEKWCSLIHQCISTTEISVLLNGSPCTPFHPTRGIRQGNPISPYLFIISMEAFSRAMVATEYSKKISVKNNFWGGSLKAKYFKNHKPLHAPKKADSTWSWKSISSEFEFIYKYNFWSLGNGENILIWQDKWVPSLNDPPSPDEAAVNIQDYKYVAELIDSTNKCWKKDIVYHLFNLEAAQKILAIRILLQSEDKLVWTRTKNGCFTVKYAYQDLYNLKYHNGADHPPVANTNLWKRIWILPLIPRIKLFLWKCAKDIISSKERLSRRFPQEEVKCKWCGCEMETTMYILLDHPFARDVWFGAGYIISDHEWVQPKQWTASWILNSDQNMIIKMAVISWQLWKDISCVFFSNKISTPNQLLHFINKFISDSKSEGYGLIFQNFAGTHLASACKYYQVASGPEQLECLEVLELLKLAIRWEFRRIAIEVDYQALVRAIQGEESDVPWESRGIVDDIKFLLLSFDLWSCKHTNRHANKYADSLAKHGRKEGISDT